MRWLSRLWRRAGHHDGPGVDGLRRDGFVALDLETTGLDPGRDAVVSLAAVPFVGGAPSHGLVTLVNPGRPIPPASTRIHGITDAMVAGAPPLARILDDLEAVCEGRVLVGHWIGFDLRVLARAREGLGRPQPPHTALCTMRLAVALHPEWHDVSLDTVATLLGVQVVGRHTAEGDAIAAGRILLAMLPALAERGLRTLTELVWFQGDQARHS
jgi:DNA polymerase III epsilon subunit family exonuclease